MSHPWCAQCLLRSLPFWGGSMWLPNSNSTLVLGGLLTPLQFSWGKFKRREHPMPFHHSMADKVTVAKQCCALLCCLLFTKLLRTCRVAVSQRGTQSCAVTTIVQLNFVGVRIRTLTSYCQSVALLAGCQGLS